MKVGGQPQCVVNTRYPLVSVFCRYISLSPNFNRHHTNAKLGIGIVNLAARVNSTKLQLVGK